MPQNVIFRNTKAPTDVFNLQEEDFHYKNKKDPTRITATFEDLSIGEEHLSKKAATVSAKHGKGRVVLIGFRAQHRCQTHGTFKLLFNALIR